MPKFYPFWIKIYEDHHGPLPKDRKGRKFEVHHIDGDRTNNDISNLQALSIEDHYQAHYNKGDWLGCLGFLPRLNKHGYIDYDEWGDRTTELRLRASNLKSDCPHCGRSFSALNWGLLRHLRFCKKNPEVIERNNRLENMRIVDETYNQLTESDYVFVSNEYGYQPNREHWMLPWELPDDVYEVM